MFNVADYALLTILAVSMAVGLWRGFVVEVLSLTVWIGAFWLTLGFGSTVAGWFGGIESVSARFFLGHAAVFLVVLLAGGGVTWLIGKAIAGTGLSSTDRVLGVGFGLARGVVLTCLAVLLLGFTPMPQDGWWRESRLIPEAQRGAEWMSGFLPEEAARHVRFDAATALPGATLPDGAADAMRPGDARTDVSPPEKQTPGVPQSAGTETVPET